MYNTQQKAIWNAQHDNWAKAKGGFALIQKDGGFDYVYSGTPLAKGEQLLAKYVWLNNKWWRYEWQNGKWVRVK